MKSGKSRRWFLTPCGLDCHGCPIRLRTKEELSYWAERKVDPERIRCAGCRSPRDENHWSPECNILECCVYERKHEFCVQCRDFPCQILEEWANEYEHHSQAISRLKEMKKTGVRTWLQERLRDV